MWALAAQTAANTAIGLDQLAATTKGGWMMYQVTAAAGAGNMTATIKVQHADTNLDGSFADLLSSGVINCVNGGVSGIVQLEPGPSAYIAAERVELLEPGPILPWPYNP